MISLPPYQSGFKRNKNITSLSQKDFEQEIFQANIFRGVIRGQSNKQNDRVLILMKRQMNHSLSFKNYDDPQALGLRIKRGNLTIFQRLCIDNDVCGNKQRNVQSDFLHVKVDEYFLQPLSYLLTCSMSM